MQDRCQLDSRTGLGELSPDRRRQMLDVRDPDDMRLGVGMRPHGVRSQHPLDAPNDDLVLLAHLGAAEHSLTEVIVHRGIGAPSRRARQRHRRRDRARAADEKLRTGTDEGRLRSPDAKAEAGWKELPEGAEQSCGVVRCGGLDQDLARQHDLVELSSLDPLHRLGDEPFVAVWGVTTGDTRPGDGVGILRWQRPGRE
jgi:hypothetical protein